MEDPTITTDRIRAWATERRGRSLWGLEVT